jgi:hypothetical protein
MDSNSCYSPLSALVCCWFEDKGFVKTRPIKRVEAFMEIVKQ